jgi:plastocyanin
VSARTGGLLALAAVAAVAVTAPGVAGAGGEKQAAPKPKVVDVRDDYFAPEVVRIRKGTRVRWDWGTEPTDAHDVSLYKSPRGLNKRKFRSPIASAPYTWGKTFRKPGTYKFRCNLHSLVMKMQVRVRR